VALALAVNMAEEKSAKGDDGRGIPAAGEQKTVDPQPSDSRMIPGGSFKAARIHIGVNAVDKEELPGVEAIEEGVVRPPHLI
jgi:hypothetical protein